MSTSVNRINIPSHIKLELLMLNFNQVGMFFYKQSSLAELNVTEKVIINFNSNIRNRLLFIYTLRTIPN